MNDEKKKKSVEENIRKSKEIIREAFKKFKNDQLGITWTGGKDSTLTLWMIKQVCDEDNIKIPKVMTIDEGDSFPEIHEIIEKYTRDWNLDVEWMINQDIIDAAGGKLGNDVEVKKLEKRNREELIRLGFTGEKFPFEAESWIGNHLMKTVMFNQFIEKRNIKGIFMGIRRDEQQARQNDEYFIKREGDAYTPEHVRIQPILHFKERDVWDTIFEHKIPFCKLYEKGYRSLGAASTTIKKSDIPAWKQDLEHTPEREGRRQDKEAAMERLRKLGYM